MPISSDLGQPKSKLMNGWILGSGIGPFAFKCNDQNMKLKLSQLFHDLIDFFFKENRLVKFGASLCVSWIWAQMDLFF